ncbi:predicted protein [Postia placenta Mad-698-R]|nr:predicted protein [Postia placenta Mad-698-R]
MAVGAEALLPHIVDQAEDENWTKVECGLAANAFEASLFQGSAIVGFRAREYLKHQLSGSRYGQDQDVDEMARQFDKTTKTIFRSPEDTAYIRFGSMRDKDPQYNIRNGAEVASIFKPSIEATKEGINRQCNDAADSISTGYSYVCLFYAPLDGIMTACRNKAVAEGAISFYLDHFVSVRVARFTYGANVRICYNPADPEHLRRVDKAYVDDAGIKRVKDAFQVVLPKTVCASVSCYTGQLNHPRWTDLEPALTRATSSEAFTSLCTVEGDTSLVPHVPKDGPNGVYYTQDFHLILSFGLTELKAQLSWRENLTVVDGQSLSRIHDRMFVISDSVSPIPDLRKVINEDVLMRFNPTSCAEYLISIYFTAKPILIDLPSQSIHFGKVGKKLAAEVGNGADTSTSGRWATKDREADAHCNPLVLSPSFQIKEATGITEFVAVYLCLQK